MFPIWLVYLFEMKRKRFLIEICMKSFFVYLVVCLVVILLVRFLKNFTVLMVNMPCKYNIFKVVKTKWVFVSTSKLEIFFTCQSLAGEDITSTVTFLKKRQCLQCKSKILKIVSRKFDSNPISTSACFFNYCEIPYIE